MADSATARVQESWRRFLIARSWARRAAKPAAPARAAALMSAADWTLEARSATNCPQRIPSRSRVTTDTWAD
eukprot:745503-Pyramimonas_sp.AAC.1